MLKWLFYVGIYITLMRLLFIKHKLTTDENGNYKTKFDKGHEIRCCFKS